MAQYYMADNNDELTFNDALCARVKQWREEKGLTAAQMATALNVPADRYRKYETRSPIPAYLMQRFCIICDANLENLIAGTPRLRHKPKLIVLNKNSERRA